MKWHKRNLQKQKKKNACERVDRLKMKRGVLFVQKLPVFEKEIRTSVVVAKKLFAEIYLFFFWYCTDATLVRIFRLHIWLLFLIFFPTRRRRVYWNDISVAGDIFKLVHSFGAILLLFF